ncbi:aquaporin-like protein [Rhexocercosporidium sp. MPI-PUGE-AT-0058]|nr:aquaporin-like protein [Rhexocercosporidium sp. MPI-PUGE-AT-0058]
MAQNQNKNRRGDLQDRQDITISLQSSREPPTTGTSRPTYHTNEQSRRSRADRQKLLRDHSTKSSRRPPQQPFSLAGGTSLPAHGVSYIDPTYHEYNPAYQKGQNTPLWGLAKPLPRVVRQGMRRGRGDDEQGTVEDAEAEIEEPGSSDVIPQVGMINDQRDDAGKDPVECRERCSNRGYGHQRSRRPNTESTVQRAGSRNSVVDTTLSPLNEKSNHLDDWHSREDPVRRPDPFDDRHGDLGERSMNRLLSVPEVPSRVILDSNVDSFNGRRTGLDPADIDLEAGEKLDEWPVEDGEEEQYLEEERDMHNSWAEFRARFREPLAECLATMVAVLVGLCTNLAVQTSNDTSGSYQSTNWAWGLGITIGIYIAGGISGAHLNPAISLMLCLYRGFPFRKAPVYISAQIFGAFLAGLIAYGLYKDAIDAFDAVGDSIGAHGGSSSTVGLSAGGTSTSFFSQPASFAGAGTGFANEFVATAILACAILALGDDSNAPPGAGMHALIVGLLVTVLTMAFGYNTSACLNPARDLGPRIAAAAVGYGGQVFTIRDAWWIYGAWGATVSGGLVGGLFYDAAIFVGGESPVNYPRGKRRLARRKAKEDARRSWWGFKRIIS